MGAKSRNKGANGERELARILREHVGDGIMRNWQGQADKGGYDLSGLPFALEVKRCATVTDGLKRQWWRQAVTQSSGTNPGSTTPPMEPALAYRGDRQEWRFVVPLTLFDNCMSGAIVDGDEYGWTADIGLEPFCQLCRERMSA